MTNREAWHKGYIDGYKGLNPRPDYPLVGLAGSYRLGYQAGEKRRKEPKGPRKTNPVSSIRRLNPTITGLKGELFEVDKTIADLETDPFYKETPGRRAYRAKWLAYHRRQRRQLEQLLKGLERAAARRTNGITEAAAGLQALEYIGGKVKRGGLGRKPKYNPRVKTLPELFAMQRTAQRAQDKAEAAKQRYGYGSARHLAAEAAYKAASQRYQRAKARAHQRAKAKARTNPRAKGSRDALGVWHAENPSKAQIQAAIKRKRNEADRLIALVRRMEAITDKVQYATYAKENEILVSTAIKLQDDANKLEDRLRKRNPSVADLSRTFQGEADGSIDQMYAATGAPANLARAGKLVFLKVAGRSIRIPGAMVAIAPNEKLWITGSGPLFETKARKGEGLDVGEVSHICYETAKTHIGEGKTFEYVHEFGEDGGKRPHLIIDHEGMPILRGGDYKIRAEGIVN